MSHESYVYKTVPGCEIGVDVYRAPRGADPSPVLVWIHGGCLMYGSRQGMDPDRLLAKYLAAGWTPGAARRVQRSRSECLAGYLGAGWTVVAIDYRLAPETLLPEIVEDLRDAFRWVREEGPRLYNADPQRVAAVGHSAGGYLSLMAGACVTPRPQAIVSFYGYGDIVGDWYSKPDPFYCQQPAISREQAYADIGHTPIAAADGARAESPIYLYCRQNGLWPNVVGGRDPEEDPAFFAPFCPIQNVGPDYPPTLLLHGDADTDVPYQQSAIMAGELSRQGIEHELITIRDGPHGFDGDLDRPQVRAAFDAVLAFLKRHLGSV